MSVIRFQPIIIYANELRKDTLTNRNNYTNSTIDGITYKFYVPHRIGNAKLQLTLLKDCDKCTNISLSIRANAFPLFNNEDNENILSTIITVNQLENITNYFETQPNSWHYMLLKFENKTQFNTLQTKFESYNFEMDYMLHIEFMNSNKNVELSKNLTDLNKYAKHYRFRNFEIFTLLRQTYREFFTYDYDLLPDENGTVPLLLNLTAGQAVGFTFELGEVYDVGGTLSFAMTMKNEQKLVEYIKTMPTLSPDTERLVLVAEKLIWTNESINSILDKSVKQKTLRTNQTIIVCMHLAVPGTPTWPDKCLYGNKLSEAAAIVNNTDINSSAGAINVPFPESGRWYITMGLFCPGAETSVHVTAIDSVKKFVYKHMAEILAFKFDCVCTNLTQQYAECLKELKCILTLPEALVLKLKECLLDAKCTRNYKEMTQLFEKQHKMAIGQQHALENCNTSVVFSISSSPCVAGRCGRFGRCFHYMSGGFVFSTCVCMTGYRGWDCSEDAQVPTKISLLMATLLLTLSNLLFLPSICIAVKRTYYTEAVIYFFAMFFSIFYHACDAGEDEFTFCLVKIGVLQFCDFYCGLLAIWVTLVAMSHVQQKFVSLLHMFGAILLAFGTELDKQSLWIFLAPALTGICIISVSWGLRCHRSKAWFPSKDYLSIYLPMGAVLVMIGLVCYAFLQTKQNYHIVHSIWHMVMALSLLCLLPKRRSCLEKS